MFARCGCRATIVAVAQKVGLTGSCFRHRHPGADAGPGRQIAPKRLDLGL